MNERATYGAPFRLLTNHFLPVNLRPIDATDAFLPNRLPRAISAIPAGKSRKVGIEATKTKFRRVE